MIDAAGSPTLAIILVVLGSGGPIVAWITTRKRTSPKDDAAAMILEWGKRLEGELQSLRVRVMELERTNTGLRLWGSALSDQVRRHGGDPVPLSDFLGDDQ